MLKHGQSKKYGDVILSMINYDALIFHIYVDFWHFIVQTVHGNSKQEIRLAWKSFLAGSRKRKQKLQLSCYLNSASWVWYFIDLCSTLPHTTAGLFVFFFLMIVALALCVLEIVVMGILISALQPSEELEEVSVGTSTSRKHGCDCKKRKRNTPCDCESEQEEDDAILDTPRRQAGLKQIVYKRIIIPVSNTSVHLI